MLTKKLVVISLVVMIVVAAAVVAVLLIVKQPSTPPANTGPQPGDSLTAEQTPDYNSCDVLDQQIIQTVFGDAMISLSKGVTSGIVAPNFENAEQCRYTFASPRSPDNSLTIQIYSRSPTNKDDKVNPFGNPEWSVIPGRAIDHTVLFRMATSEDSSQTNYYIYVDTGSKAFVYIVTQPSSALAIDGERTLDVMIALANAGNYEASTPTDAPPAPSI